MREWLDDETCALLECVGVGWHVCATLAVGLFVGTARRAMLAAKRREAASERHRREQTPSPPTSDKPFKLGDLIEPFDPPPLAELDKTAEWVDSPVVDGMARLREAKAERAAAGDGRRSAGDAQRFAGGEREDSQRSSVLAPPDGKGVDWDATFNRALIMRPEHASIRCYRAASPRARSASLTSFGLFGFDRNLIPFAAKEYVVSWQTSKDHMMDKVVHARRPDLVRRQADHRARRRVLVQADHVERRAGAGGAAGHRPDALGRGVRRPHAGLSSTRSRWPRTYSTLNFPIIPKHVYEKSIAEDPTLRTQRLSPQSRESPGDGGPYEVARWSRGQEFVAQAAARAITCTTASRCATSRISRRCGSASSRTATRALLALKAGDIEESELEAEQWVTQTNGDDSIARTRRSAAPNGQYMYIGWNMDTNKVPFFTDLRVRQAMAYALDYDEMLDDLCLRTLHAVHRQSIIPTAWMYPKNPSKPFHRISTKRKTCSTKPAGSTATATAFATRKSTAACVPFEFTLDGQQQARPDRDLQLAA